MYKRLALTLVCCLYVMIDFISPVHASQAKPALSREQEVDLLRVVVLDVSGSMDITETKGLNRLETACKEIQEALAQLPASPQAPVILVPFSNKVWADYELVYTDTKDLRKALAKLRPKGSTNIASGLSRAIDRINQLGLAENLVIYLYSDGENDWGTKKLVAEQEERLDKLFGLRASKGLSQTVVVKRWGGVIGKLVANLQKNQHVRVVDAGQLELRTVTLLPSVKVNSLEWYDATSGLVKIQLDVAVANRSGITLPEKTTIRVSCLLPGCRWLKEPSITVTGPIQEKTFELLLKLDAEKLNTLKNYSLPLRFHWPSQIHTDKGLLLPVVNPTQISCILPAGQLRSQVSISARLSGRGGPRWEDSGQCIAAWPMRLQLETKTLPSIQWSEQLEWRVYGLDGVKVTIDGPIILLGSPKEVNITLTKKIPRDQVLQMKSVKVQIELRAVSKPQTLALLSMCDILTVQADLPAMQMVRIDQRISYVGKPQWADLTAGLVTVPVKLDIRFHGILVPGTAIGLIPHKDVVRVGGTPVAIHSGQQTVDIILTGKVDSAGCQVKWPLRLNPPPSLNSIRYLEPPPVTVSFIAPQPVQVVLGGKAGILTRCTYRGDKPQQAILGYGCVKVAGTFEQYADAGLRVKGLLQGHLGGKGFSKAGSGDWVRWSMQSNDPATHARLWYDVAARGNLMVLPENAAPGAVLGSVIGLVVTYEALYKKIVLSLVVGLVAVLVGTMLFWLVKNMSQVNWKE